MALPLTGISVLDFSALLPGPFASAMLARAGARVVKIERPEGDDLSRMPPFVEGESVLYRALTTSKEVVRLDLREAAGRAAALQLAADADVVLTQVRPGVMERLGLGYEQVRSVNPRAIYCAITGYGQSGPDAGRAGHDLNYVADAGLLSATTLSPQVPAGLVADVGGGSLPAVLNILLALRLRDQTGRGSFLDISITGNVAAFMAYATAESFAGGRFDAAGSPFGGASPRYRLYPTRDGGHLAVGAIEEKFWRAFLAAIGLAAMAGREGADLGDAIAARVLEETTAHWRAHFSDQDCCVSVLDPARADGTVSLPRAAQDGPVTFPIVPQFLRAE